MAAVNFPNNPSTNDTHTSSGSTWKWDGTVWQRLGVAGPQGAQGVQGATGSASLSNNADNRVITGGSGTNLNGEANLTFDGTSLLIVHVPSATGEPAINFTNSDTGTGTGNGFGLGLNDAESPYIWNRENTDIRIATNNTEKVRITSTGELLIGTTTPGESSADDLTIANSGHAGITVRSGTSSWGSFFFSDGTSGGAEYDGAIEYKHSDNYMRFRTAQTERFRITSTGSLQSFYNTALPVTDSRPILQLGYSSIGDDSAGRNNTATNAYPVNGDSSWHYIGSSSLAAARHELGFGEHKWYTSAAGTRGNDITWLERLRITSGGQVQINTDGSQTASNISVGAGADLKLYHDGSDSYIRNITDTDLKIQNIGNAGIEIQTQNSYPITINTNGTERVRIDSDGRLGINGAGVNGMLEVRASGGAADKLTAVFGANEGTTAGTLTDNTDKACRIGIQNYDTDAKPFAMLVGSSTNGVNSLNFGGGTSLMNAATVIKFATQAGQTNNGGLEKMRITSEGRIQYYTTAGSFRSFRETFMSAAISNGGTFTAQTHNCHACGTVTITTNLDGSSNNKRCRQYPISLNSTSNANLGSALFTIDGSSGQDFSVAGASKGVTVTNSSGNTVYISVTFDITGSC